MTLAAQADLKMHLTSVSQYSPPTKSTTPMILLRPSRILPQLARSRCYSTITEQSKRTKRPFRLAVIGAGPAGFYTSYRVLSKLTNAHVDMYESLPVPYGLVRFGVAPDHPEVKVHTRTPSMSNSALTEIKSQ